MIVRNVVRLGKTKSQLQDCYIGLSFVICANRLIRELKKALRDTFIERT
jgi:hypothetical protein